MAKQRTAAMAATAAAQGSVDTRKIEAGTVLGPRELNRALLARQHLLRRSDMPVPAMMEHLIGLQAQAPNPPYYGLWTRLNGFRQEELARLIQHRDVVRIALMRSTIHMVTARDCLELRPLLQPMLARAMTSSFGKRMGGVDLDALAEAGRALVEEQPLTFRELGARLLERWPDADPGRLAYAVRNLVPLVQIPPRGLWGSSGQPTHTSAEAWLGRPLSADSAVEQLLVRYLAAFGPATVKDMQAWSGLTRLADIVERLRPQLVTFRDIRGNELFDVPDAPLPDGDTPAPVKFVGEFDNLILSHEDRTRIIADEYRQAVITVNGLVRSTILVDGFVRGIWKIERQRKAATLVIEPFAPVSAQERDALAEEGSKLLAFAAAEGDSHDIRFA